jgi:hypothetical protein
LSDHIIVLESMWGMIDWRKFTETNDNPHGLVDSREQKEFKTQHGVSMLVKQVARHISKELPSELVGSQSRVEYLNKQVAFKHTMEGFDTSKLPVGFGNMILALETDQTITLPASLYRAAFAREVFGKRTFLIGLANDENFINWVVYTLLLGAGYDVKIGKTAMSF